jgi:cytochrome d ubiquinol oxidase subunit II
MFEAQTSALPLIFFLLMGFAILLYAILDGYDLGVGILLPKNSETQRDMMIASIGPFWDANETWLVLAIGLLLIAFPQAYNLVFEHLYLITCVMLIGLILRGVSFDFRAKAIPERKETWDLMFKLGSIITSLAQGYMIGRFVTGFDDSSSGTIFALISALCVAAGYTYIGGAWLIMKTEGVLQLNAIKWTRRAGWLMATGIVLVTIVNLSTYASVQDKWLNEPAGLLLLPIPFACMMLFFISDQVLKHMPFKDDHGSWLPFFSAASIFVLCFAGLGFSFYPWVVPTQLTIWEAAAADASLEIILYGAIFVVPTIIAYTFFAYRVFWGKARPLQYY